jgi:hypothetical protein
LTDATSTSSEDFTTGRFGTTLAEIDSGEIPHQRILLATNGRIRAAFPRLLDAAVSRNESGWFVEMSIPFSQLRFAKGENQTWGINASRFLFRRNESSWFELVPKSEYGLASRFVNLTGIEGVEPGHNLEVLPCIRGDAQFSPSTPGDPFNDGSKFSSGSGLDVNLLVQSIAG